VSLDQKNGCRDLALLSLMFNTGARVSEIIGVQTTDLRLLALVTCCSEARAEKKEYVPSVGNRNPPAKLIEQHGQPPTQSIRSSSMITEAG